MTRVRLPYGPLEDYVRARHQPLNEDEHVVLGSRRLGPVVGVHGSTIERWRRDGVLPIYAADKAAVALGQHPSAIWGDDWWAA